MMIKPMDILGLPSHNLINFVVARENFAHADGEKHHGQLIFINS